MDFYRRDASMTDEVPSILNLDRIDEEVTNKAKEESEYIAELDEIFARLHASDERIAKNRKDIERLGEETRAMLTDLRKQFG
jgi:predicted  nucleic acid-binding Zn-ribbon protein